MDKIKRFLKEEEGLEMSEYALMGALICIAVAAAVIIFRDAIVTVFTDMTTALGQR